MKSISYKKIYKYLKIVVSVAIIQLVNIQIVDAQNSYTVEINDTPTYFEFKNNFIDFPKFKIKSYDLSSNDYIFIGYYSKISSPYLIIMDKYTTPIFIKKLTGYGYDFKINGNGFITYYDNARKQFYIMDSMYQVVDSVLMKNDYITDYHDMQITSDGHFLLIGQELKVIAMDTIVEDGSPNATVIGLIIQELDERKNLIFQWESWDHYKITDTYSNLSNQTVDYVHANSISIDTDDNLLISACYMSEITKIDRFTGDIIWRLGGKNNEFTFLNDNGFSGQHDIRRLPNGNITLFDNYSLTDTMYSSGVEYKIDEFNKTVELIQCYRHIPDLQSFWMGNMQKLSNGNVLIGWGQNKDFYILTEFDSSGKIVYEIISQEEAESYRAFKFPWKTTLFKSNIDTVDFGIIDYGNNGIQNIVIKNNSSSEIELSGYSTHNSVYSILNTFPIVLPPFGEVSLIIQFNPSVNGGYFNDVLTLNSDGYDLFGNPQRIAIQVYLNGHSPDIHSPEIETYPLSNTNNVPIDTMIEISFNEPVRYIDNTNLTVDNIKSSISFTKDDLSATDVLFNVILNSDSNKIEIHPLNPLEYSENYVLTIYPFFEDFSDNVIEQKQINFTTELSTSIVSEKSIKESIIFPNPTNGIINFLNNGFVDKIEMMNFTGNIIFSKKSSNEDYITINIDDQIKGIYFIRISYTDGANVTHKVIKL